MPRKFELVLLNKHGEIGKSISNSQGLLLIAMAYAFREQIRHTYHTADWARGDVTHQDAAILQDISDIIEIVGAATDPASPYIKVAPGKLPANDK